MEKTRKEKRAMTPRDIQSIRKQAKKNQQAVDDALGYAITFRGTNYLSLMSRATGYSTGVLKAFLEGNYHGDNSAVAEELQRVWERRA